MVIVVTLVLTSLIASTCCVGHNNISSVYGDVSPDDVSRGHISHDIDTQLFPLGKKEHQNVVAGEVHFVDYSHESNIYRKILIIWLC